MLFSVSMFQQGMASPMQKFFRQGGRKESRVWKTTLVFVIPYVFVLSIYTQGSVTFQVPEELVDLATCQKILGRGFSKSDLRGPLLES